MAALALAHDPASADALRCRLRWLIAVVRETLAVMAAATMVALASPARAEPRSRTPVPVLALDWSAPAECPDGAWIRARVEQLVGRSHAERTLSAEATLTASRTTPPYRLVLRVQTVTVKTGAASQERTMTDTDCARLAEAAALILALDIEQELPPPPPEDEDAIEPAPPAPERAKVETRTSRPPQPPARANGASPRLEWRLSPRLVFDEGSLPRSTLGLGGAAEIAVGALAFDLGGTLFRPRFAGGSFSGSGGAYVDLAVAFANGCVRTSLEQVGLRACVGIELGRERTRGIGIVQPGVGSALWGAGVVSAFARPWQARSLAPIVGVALGHPFVAPDVVIGGVGTVFEPSALFVRIQLGLEIDLF